MSGNTLRVTGVRCARVASVGSAAEGDVDQIFDIIRTWEPEGLPEDNYPPGGLMLDAFLEAVFQGCLRDRFPRTVSWPTLSELREHYLALLSGTDRRANILKYLQNGVAKAAKFFTTKEGYFGVANKDVNEGDVVCIMLGCDMPLLIRSTEQPNGTFNLVGICFVPGLLDSEGLLGHLPENWKLQMIFKDGSLKIRGSNLSIPIGQGWPLKGLMMILTFFNGFKTRKEIESRNRIPDFFRVHWTSEVLF
ncbi:hypothetical protein CEP52_017411 [Fusarium oligoseptatum]|uniref:Uncharacterized protein n=1 Tax=Fusarium oligoseptatum TaxID=2604345 RepID=A0A428RRZ3_9HYPO|nr:hypothetical protein CEP52_017411 [Fusarium oligoseptatum]